MSKEQEQRLFDLIEIADTHQKAAQTALDGLVAERKALAAEREKLAAQIAALGEGTSKAAKQGVANGFAGVAVEGVKAVQAATKPLLDTLAGVTADAERAETALRRVVSWASWQLLFRVIGVVAALLLLGWISGAGLVWWDTGTVHNLQEEVTDLKANRDALVKAGMLGKLTYCGQNSRPCIQVDESAGAFGTNSDYRIILGY